MSAASLVKEPEVKDGNSLEKIQAVSFESLPRQSEAVRRLYQHIQVAKLSDLHLQDGVPVRYF